MKKATIKTYSAKEEALNVWSHFAGILLALVGLVLLLIKGIMLQSSYHIITYLVYGLSMILLFSASTLYHSAKNPEKRLKLKVFDHVAIYFLIAGTYTPFTLLALKGTWGWSIFGVVWGIGIIGMVLKLFFTGRFSLVSTLSYVLMGWVVVIAIKPLINSMTAEALLWLAIGGFFYTVGAVLYSIKKVPYNHAIFHFFVLGGALSHFLAIYFYV